LVERNDVALSLTKYLSDFTHFVIPFSVQLEHFQNSVGIKNNGARPARKTVPKEPLPRESPLVHRRGFIGAGRR
jgi:hypothetical protein